MRVSELNETELQVLLSVCEAVVALEGGVFALRDEAFALMMVRVGLERWEAARMAAEPVTRPEDACALAERVSLDAREAIRGVLVSLRQLPGVTDGERAVIQWMNNAFSEPDPDEEDTEFVQRPEGWNL